MIYKSGVYVKFKNRPSTIFTILKSKKTNNGLNVEYTIKDIISGEVIEVEFLQSENLIHTHFSLRDVLIILKVKEIEAIHSLKFQDHENIKDIKRTIRNTVNSYREVIKRHSKVNKRKSMKNQNNEPANYFKF